MAHDENDRVWLSSAWRRVSVCMSTLQVIIGESNRWLEEIVAAIS